MALPNIFTKEVSSDIIERINKLSAETQGQWGKMTVALMLAHCNVTYEMIYDDIHAKPNFLVRLMLKSFVKSSVVNETPYGQNLRTAPQFLIKDEKNFDIEKGRLIQYIQKTQELGENTFDNKASHSFGNLTKTEWNNMFYKHLEHHLSQFGV